MKTVKPDLYCGNTPDEKPLCSVVGDFLFQPAGPFSDLRQRFAKPAAACIGVVGRPDRDDINQRIRSAGAGAGVTPASLASLRVPHIVSGRVGSRQPDLVKNFIQTFLEQDLRQWGMTAPSLALLRFWTMLAHSNGQLWNVAEPAGSLGISEPTVRGYLNLLTGLFMIRELHPCHANLKKRQIKAPRLTPSMRIAMEDLKLDRIMVVYPGERRYALAENIHAVPLKEIADGASGFLNMHLFLHMETSPQFPQILFFRSNVTFSHPALYIKQKINFLCWIGLAD